MRPPATFGLMLSYKLVGGAIQKLADPDAWQGDYYESIPGSTSWTAVGYADDLSLSKYAKGKHEQCRVGKCESELPHLKYTIKRGNPYVRWRVDQANSWFEGAGGTVWLPSQLTNW